MRLFDPIEAEYFCRAFTPEAGLSTKSLDEFSSQRLKTGSMVKEGSPLFSEYRACVIREVERSLFLAASHYRRCLDCLIPGADHWAHVTMYYGSWFAARAILGMFGGAVRMRGVVDVEDPTTGSQALLVKAFGNGANQEFTNTLGNDSHRRFWEVFYRSVQHLSHFVTANLATILSPIQGDPSWLIRKRNEVNYAPYRAIHDACTFQASFNPAAFPASLTGDLATQYRVFDGLVEMSFDWAQQFGVISDALALLAPAGTRGQKIDALVYVALPPAVAEVTKRGHVTR